MLSLVQYMNTIVAFIFNTNISRVLLKRDDAQWDGLRLKSISIESIYKATGLKPKLQLLASSNEHCVYYAIDSSFNDYRAEEGVLLKPTGLKILDTLKLEPDASWLIRLAACNLTQNLTRQISF